MWIGTGWRVGAKDRWIAGARRVRSVTAFLAAASCLTWLHAQSTPPKIEARKLEQITASKKFKRSDVPAITFQNELKTSGVKLVLRNSMTPQRYSKNMREKLKTIYQKMSGDTPPAEKVK